MTSIKQIRHDCRMQSVMKCSFCQKRQGMIRDLVAPRRHAMTVCICDECVNSCQAILAKAAKEHIAETAAETFKVSPLRHDQPAQLCCSFCDTPQEVVDKLIGAPAGVAAAYICDKCVAACSTSIRKDVTRGGPKNLWHWIARKAGIHPSQIHQIN